MIKHKFLTLFVAIVATAALWAGNIITYTATEKLTRYTLDVGETTFGSAITSHDFSNGIGTITCDGEVTTIGDEAFYYCYGLTSVTIPNSVTTIGYEAFGCCSGLTSVTIPNSVTTIGMQAFEGCTGLTSVTIPNSVTTIGSWVFAYCSGLTSVTIPNSVTTIGIGAFEGCSGLTSITIPNSVTWIGDWAFNNCSGLTSITIPNSVTTIGYGAFAFCDGLTTINVDTANTHYASMDGVLFNYVKDTLIQYPIGNPRTEYTIPNSVTTIGEQAFALCYGLTSVTIPNSVTTIGMQAFEGCTGLTSINVDAANTHYASIDGVLFNYTKDTLIQYPIGNPRTEYTIPNSVTTIGYGAFALCSGLTSVTIGNSVTTIGRSAFEGCSGLTSVTIPNSVTTIGDGAFYSCTSLTSVTIGNSVTTIGSSAFFGCSGLRSVTIPYSVTSIDDWAFGECSSLTEVTIGNSVTTIGDYAFSDCSGLTSITCEATTPPACEYNCFYDVDKSIPLYVLASSVDAYKAADEWRDFTDIRPITAEEVEVTEIEAEPTESAVEIAWPSVVNAETYTIEIRLGDQLICSIVFNAEGQLVSINFNLAPGRGGHTYATTAESTATGWAYTIAGLNPGITYTYSVIAKNADEQVIDTKSGSFTTKGATAIENVSADVNTTKFLHNGQVIFQKNDRTFTILGQEVR